MKPDAIQASSRLFVRATTPEDAAAIVALMADVRLQPNVEQRHLHWKYWQDREDWHEPRSYVLSDGRRLLAHTAFIPLSYQAEGRYVRVAHLIDWAARPEKAGAGAMLLRYVAAHSDALIGIGGSDATVKLLPILGFHKCGSVRGYVRTLRPLKLLADASRLTWRLIPRIGRSAAWCITAPRSVADQWRARRIGVDRISELAPLAMRTPGAASVFERSDGLLRYVLSCPIAPVECFVVEQGLRPRGYFMLAFTGGQARLVDAGVDTDALADWRALIDCAVREAKRNTAVGEIAAWASDPTLAQSLEERGFHARFALPLWIRSGKSAAFSPTSLRVQMLDSDAAYFHAERGIFWA